MGKLQVGTQPHCKSLELRISAGLARDVHLPRPHGTIVESPVVKCAWIQDAVCNKRLVRNIDFLQQDLNLLVVTERTSCPDLGTACLGTTQRQLDAPRRDLLVLYRRR